MRIRFLLTFILGGALVAWAQLPAGSQTSAAPSTPAHTESANPSGDMQQLTAQVSSLSSMMNAMRSQVSGVRDESVRSALLTEAQMWELVINDMQRRIERLRAKDVGSKD